jgi:hypothetical protein
LTVEHRLASTALLVIIAALLLASPAAGAERLRVITVDRPTGKQLPARISVRGPDGLFSWGADARGRPLEYGGLPRHWSEGTLDLEVGAGRVLVLASRPFSWLPASREVTVEPGAAAAVTLELEPLVDLRALGWYGGDAHTHVVHGERHFAMDLPLAARIAKAEGLDWAALGEVWTSLEETQPSPARLAEIARGSSDERFLCGWTREHPKDHLGHMAAFPLEADRDFEEAVGGNPYAGDLERREPFTHFEVARSLPELGSLAVYTHPTREYGGTEASRANIARELPFDVLAAPWVLSALDVLTDAPENAANLKLWRFLLDRGLQVAACGFSDACFDRRGERPGDTRTYVSLGTQPPTMRALAAAVRAGRTFATTGPLVLFEVEGSPPGTVFPADGRPREARVRAYNGVDHGDPHEPAFVERLEVLRDGETWKELRVEAGKHQAAFSFRLEEKESGWYAVQVHGSSPRQFAVTSPVYFRREAAAAPAPAMARVEGRVRGPGGRPLAGKVEAVEYGKGHLRVVAEAPLEDGRYRFRCPAACRIQPRVPGFRPALKSIFLDCDPIYRELFWPIRREKLWDPGFYREIERRLGAVVLDFELAPE